MSTALRIGDAEITRCGIPRCDGCSRYGRDHRCDCAGTGWRLECAHCGDTVRDPERHGYLVEYRGQFSRIEYRICDREECLLEAKTELIEMQRPVREGRAA